MVNALTEARILVAVFGLMCTAIVGVAQTQTLLNEKRHLRNTGDREWSSFPKQADSILNLNFSCPTSSSPVTLQLTQFDVKQRWMLHINETAIGQLVADENRLTTYFDVPPSVLNPSGNVLTISTEDAAPDDIMVDDIKLYSGKQNDLLTAGMEVEVVDGDGTLIPARITIVNQERSLHTIVSKPDANVAVRPGCIYILGRASFSIQPGSYTLYANHGFEFGVDSVRLTLRSGDQLKHRFVIRREVDTKGWISSDTHVHTFTHSRHGDATERERIITLVGEGIEMPVSTDHNKYLDLSKVRDSVNSDAARYGMRELAMSTVMGDEVTTKVGHFNVFRIRGNAPLIAHNADNWTQLSDAINVARPHEVVILNHARDVHNTFRPFDPSRHLQCAGMDRDRWTLPANAMEVINSGSQQSDFTQLFHDWMGMLNGGTLLTPIGSSDSHDVNRYIVGQGRTYISVADENPADLDIETALRSLVQGRVMVSCGLLTRIHVNSEHGPGDLVRQSKSVKVTVDVLGPAWANAEWVELYMNGVQVKRERVKADARKPIKNRFTWDVNVPSHDVYFAAIAYGKAVNIPYWPIAKPYSPTSTDWTPHFYGTTGSVWVDGDGDGTRRSASYYASKLCAAHGQNTALLLQALTKYDEAVAQQVAALLWSQGTDLRSAELRRLVEGATVSIRSAFDRVTEETNQIKQ